MGSLENSLINCHIFRNLLKRIDRIHGEFVDHENTIPKCEVCWENHSQFNTLKAQLLVIVQEHELLQEENASMNISTEDHIQSAPVTMVVIKEEEKPEATEDDHVAKNDLDDVEWNPWECNNETTDYNTTSMVVYTDNKIKENIKRINANDNEEVFECALCGKTYGTKLQLITHMRLHIKRSSGSNKKDNFCKENNLTCSICCKKLNTPSGLKRHMKFHEKKENPEHIFKRSKQKSQYSCEFCKKSFRYPGALERHNEVRDSSKLHCGSCNESFCLDTDFDSHRKTAHKEKTTFQCCHCDEHFTNFRVIYKHHKTQHPGLLGPTKPFLCDTCGLAMIDSRDLKRHMMIHRGLKPHKCDVCEKTFRLKTEVEQHRRVHIPSSEIQAQYACPMCPKKFRTNVTLWRHKRIHTGQVKETICQVCRRRITNPKSLEIHMLKHANEGPRLFKCEDCGRSFNKLKYLNQHRKDAHNILTDLMLNPKPARKKKV